MNHVQENTSKDMMIMTTKSVEIVTKPVELVTENLILIVLLVNLIDS
jgi:hypothetical protein